MALFEKNGILIGIGVGLVAAGLVKGLGPAFKGIGRPVAKGLIKGGILAYDVGREGLAHATEYIEDLVAEARAEMAEEPLAAASEVIGPPQPEGGSVQ